MKTALNLSQTKIDELISEHQQIQDITQQDEEELSEHHKQISSYENIIEKLREKYKKLCIEHKVEFQEDDDNTEIKTMLHNENSKSISEDTTEKNNELSINENIEKGFQRISLKLMSSSNKLKPINDLITDDLKNNEKIAIIYEKAKSIILNLAIQVILLKHFYLLNILKNEVYNEKLKQVKPNNEILNKQSSSGMADQKNDLLQKKIVTLEKDLSKAKVSYFYLSSSF